MSAQPHPESANASRRLPAWLASPWSLLAFALAGAAVTVLLGAFGQAAAAARGVLLFVSLVAAGGAVWWRLSTSTEGRQAGAGWDFQSRTRTAAFVALACAVGLLAVALIREGLGEEPGNIHAFLFGVPVVVVAGVVLLILLPDGWRKAALGVLVLLHFGAILVAVVLLPPPKQPAPWLAREATAEFYRPYHQLFYLGNAYHFYAPDPPDDAPLLWFYVTYDDGSHRWVRVPEREQARTSVEVQRGVSLAGYVNRVEPFRPPPQWTERRIEAGNQQPQPVPTHPDVLPVESQLQLPAARFGTLQFLSSYARHVARSYPSESNPEAKVFAVKIYRVMHSVVTPERWATGHSPHDITLYHPYYQGEYDPEGRMLTPGDDPFLFWLIPILGVEDGQYVPLEYHARNCR
jgi:hypothetical protein